MQTAFPGFFRQVPSIRLHDPLAEFLGSAADGLIEYRYEDAVRLAGHSCPTVASAYGLTRLALKALFADAIPVRGAVRVAFQAAAADGVTGVIAAVTSLLTGAAGETGFKGLAGRFQRHGLLAFEAAPPLAIRFTRLDTGSVIDAACHPGRVPAPAALGHLLQRCLSGLATPAEAAEFRHLWQDRVRRLLIEHGDDPEVFVLRPSPARP